MGLTNTSEHMEQCRCWLGGRTKFFAGDMALGSMFSLFFKLLGRGLVLLLLLLLLLLSAAAAAATKDRDLVLIIVPKKFELSFFDRYKKKVLLCCFRHLFFERVGSCIKVIIAKPPSREFRRVDGIRPLRLKS